MKKLVLFSAISIVLFSCGGLKDMQVQVLRPAAISIPNDIDTLALLNRSIPTTKSGFEATLTGETPTQDKELSEECIRGLTESLYNSNRYYTVRCGETMNAPDGKSLTFSAPLNWSVVDSICTATHAKALLVLEYFDTDYSIINPGATAANAVGSVLNGQVPHVTVTGKGRATCGYRVYVPSIQKVIYEDRFEFNKVWTQTSANPAEAIARLIKRKDALIDISYLTGAQFAAQILPLYYWEHRYIYKGKKGYPRMGYRQGLTQNWDGAIESWNKVYTTSTKSKVRAKAAFNLALAYEIKGDLETAKKWVQEAYVLKPKQAILDYSMILENRLREQVRLNYQLKTDE